MKELSKEDQERKQINFAASEIYDRLIGPQRDGIQTFIYNQIFVLVDHYKDKARKEGFNEALEEVGKILMDGSVAAIEYKTWLFDRIQTIKK